MAHDLRYHLGATNAGQRGVELVGAVGRVAHGRGRIAQRLFALLLEPPGGLLGLVLSASMIERDLKWVFEHRAKKLAELLGTA